MTRISLIALLALAACTSPAPVVPAPTTPPARPADCRGSIERLETPPADRETVLDVVALPTDRVLQANPTEVPNQLFAKDGLVVLASATVTIATDVPGATVDWQGLAADGQAARHEPCAGATGWLVYPGGYVVPQPMCLPVTVRTGGREQTVHIGVGAACP